VLRTVFTFEQDEPVQMIGKAAHPKLEVIDLTGIEQTRREEEVKRLINEEAACGFDLTRGPLLRAKIISLESRESVLLVTLHHIISDGWSLGILNREAAELYGAYCEGREAVLTELPVQYADFAQWQREWMAGAVLEEQLDYWKKQLGNNPKVMNLAKNKFKSETKKFQGARQKSFLDKDLTKDLKQFSQREGATLYMVMLAGFNVLLKHYSGEEEIVVGTDVANRTRRETEGLIGFFVNQLVMKTWVGGEADFREVVRRVREVALEAYANQEVPFEKVVEAINPQRDTGRTPLFQVKFVLQNTGAELNLKGLKVEQENIEIGTAKYDLMMNIQEKQGELEVMIEYDLGILDGDMGARMLCDYELIFKSIVLNPNLKIEELEAILVEAGRQRQQERGRELEQTTMIKFRTARRKPVEIA
jgi:hypothetical protein